MQNIFLNDFDWTIARRWQIPKREKEYTQRYSARNYLRRVGFDECFLTRYADDWVIQVRSKNQAENLLRELKKYFRHKLKIELSDEKTVITNMTANPVKFLGFNIVAESVKRTRDGTRVPSGGRLVGKNYPNPDKVREQIRSLSADIKGIRRCKTITETAPNIERINARIVGIAEYWKTGMAKRTLTKIDHSVFLMARASFRWLYGRLGLQRYRIPLSMLDNRPQRHQGYTSETYAVQVGHIWVGFTNAQITKIEYEKCMFDQRMTPYSPEGRERYYSQAKRRRPLDRPPLYDPEFLWKVAIEPDGLYNFEYFMNREYAYNRDKGKCRACKVDLHNGNRHCHHVRPWLVMKEVNKVSELAWVCNECHRYIHGDILPEDKKVASKIQRFRVSLRP